jgi:hypothetical protein
MYMPVCLLIAHSLMSYAGGHAWQERLLKAAFGIAGAAFLLLGAAAGFLFHNVLPQLPLWQRVLMSVSCGAAGIGILHGAFKNRWSRCRTTSLCANGLAIVFLPLFLLPQWEFYKPVRVFSEWLRAHRQPGDYSGYYKYSAPSLTFYLQEPIFEIIWEDQILHFLSNSRRRTFCILTQDQFESIRSRLKQPYHVVSSHPILSLKARDLFRLADPDTLPQLLLICNSP